MDAVLADAVVAFHAAFILFALLGGILLVRWPRLIWLHLPALAWAGWIEFSGNYCPLTPLENHFRERAGTGGYGEGFIDHYVTPIIYPEGLTHGTQVVFGAVLVGINAIFYMRWIIARQQRRLRGEG